MAKVVYAFRNTSSFQLCILVILTLLPCTQEQASRHSNTSTGSSLVVSRRAEDDPAKKIVRRLVIDIDSVFAVCYNKCRLHSIVVEHRNMWHSISKAQH